MIKLWLDDVRPAPEGWFHAKTAQEAIRVLQNNEVEQASLDHDLGECRSCFKKRCPEIKKRDGGHQSGEQCRCDCHQTGCHVIKWMIANGIWPNTKPQVHTANSVARPQMIHDIERFYSKKK